ncbi:hypothetical protein SAMN05216315_11638 [Nitrosospira sp. Nsp18]|uniref:three component ABC system middle component n=1 Tax=Nitrosospira sp. Nsp18 TaxID=1855334 RepID=UPI00088EECA4|nr:three component ABC system middle component [Nitrosospira sp. Nsp18]SDA21419.1 hypothetical protein SAMN05216315_11638 [Nitrosospira sp. Nsp18]
MNSSPIDFLFTLQRSPFALAPVIHQFYETSDIKERSVLLSYLVLPMVLYPPMRAFLIGANKTSSLRTMCKKQSRLVGLAARVQDFKSLTNAAMLILTAERGIEVADDLSVRSIGEVRVANANKELLDAGRKISIVFSSVNVVSIYRTLGLKSL